MTINQTVASAYPSVPRATFYTTPIFYANGEPHLGHAYTAIITDVFHRFFSLLGSHSQLITGTDEHGQKIAGTAQSSGKLPQEFVDQLSQTFSSLWPKLTIEPDVFIRTTDQDHKAHIQTLWRQLQQQGDIYLGNYSGDYCVACEQYYPKRELIDGSLCPIHKQPIEHVEEQTYLFRLEKYRQALLDYYKSNPDVIVPSHFQKTLIEQLESSPLEDLSVSRVNNQWGIQVPSDPEHTVYVWIDALFSYISAIQRSGSNEQAIANTEHVIGKDILQFHAVYWPAFLLALDLPLPRKLIVHGWWTINGEKISKSNPETTVNPSQFAERLTVDGLRYALVRQKPLYRDGNVVLDEFAELINADLLNNFANLVKRNHTLIDKLFAGEISLDKAGCLDEECQAQLSLSAIALSDIVDAYFQRDLYRVTKEVNTLLSELNAFFHHRAPWLASNAAIGEHSELHAAQTCLLVGNVVTELTWLLSPIVPELANRILAELNTPASSILTQGRLSLRNVSIQSANSHWQRV